LVLVPLLAVGCGASTTLRVSLALSDGAPTPDRVLVSVFDPRGLVVDARDVLAGRSLPGDVVVLVSDDAGVIRVLAVGETGATPRLDAAGEVMVPPGRESRLTLRLSADPLPDTDGDGVPDAIDRCPTKPDRAQDDVICGADPLDGGLSTDSDPPMDETPSTEGCGDGVVQVGEACDDGPANSDAPGPARCTTQCAVRAPCGSLSGSTGASIDPASGHCYVAWPAQKPFAAAERQCQGRGGHLASVTSAAEEQMIEALAGAAASWIGLYLPPGGGGRFTSGETQQGYQAFAPGRPDGAAAGERCVGAAASGAGSGGEGGWDDRGCGWLATGMLPFTVPVVLPFICEQACGNGVVEPGEECDPPGPTCTAICRMRRPCSEPGGVVSLSGRCYFATTLTYAYAAALTACPAGTHLAAPNDPAETEAAVMAVATDSWIALRAATTPYGFAWEAGADKLDLTRYHGFVDADPDLGVAPACTVVSKGDPRGDGWRDRACTARYPALCERD
jgi:hypothetical protein